jgi:hypothetical protein
MPNFGACRCGTRWRQIGNRTGHCGSCHCTFSSLTAFDDHQSMQHGKSVCADPAELLTKAGEPRYRTFTDPLGAVVWRSTAERPPDTWTRRNPNHPQDPPAEPRTPVDRSVAMPAPGGAL